MNYLTKRYSLDWRCICDVWRTVHIFRRYRSRTCSLTLCPDFDKFLLMSLFIKIVAIALVISLELPGLPGVFVGLPETLKGSTSGKIQECCCTEGMSRSCSGACAMRNSSTNFTACRSTSTVNTGACICAQLSGDSGSSPGQPSVDKHTGVLNCPENSQLYAAPKTFFTLKSLLPANDFYLQVFHPPWC